MGLRVRKDKNHALKLRLHGYSYTEIQRELGIPKSTLSGWFSSLVLPKKAQARIQSRVHEKSVKALIKRNKNQTHLAIQRMKLICSQARKEIAAIHKEELKLIGISLYWAEGYKRHKVLNGREVTNHPVSLTNSDPKLIGIFLRFLREVCNVSDKKIRAEIRLYQHLNEQELLSFWQQVTKLPIENFSKSYYGVSKSSQNKRPFNRLPYGTLLVRVNDTNLFHKIIGWIEGLAVQSSANLAKHSSA